MKVPKLTPVKSSNIQAVGFNNDGLFVQFAGGGTYVYPEAKKAVHDALVKAPSVGSYFAQNIRGKLTGRKLDAEP